MKSNNIVEKNQIQAWVVESLSQPDIRREVNHVLNEPISVEAYPSEVNISETSPYKLKLKEK